MQRRTARAGRSAAEPDRHFCSHTSTMSVNLPNILLEIPRNVYTAIGFPVALGLLSGSQTRNVVDGNWYKVR